MVKPSCLYFIQSSGLFQSFVYYAVYQLFNILYDILWVTVFLT